MSEQIPTEVPQSTRILDTILGDLNGRRGFRQEFEQIDPIVKEELNATVIGKIEERLRDPLIPQDQRARAIVDEVIDDLSDRRGLRQGFFDELFFDDDAVKDYQVEHPDIEVSDDESRTGIARQLTALIEPLV